MDQLPHKLTNKLLNLVSNIKISEIPTTGWWLDATYDCKESICSLCKKDHAFYYITVRTDELRYNSGYRLCGLCDINILPRAQIGFTSPIEPYVLKQSLTLFLPYFFMKEMDGFTRNLTGIVLGYL